MAGVLAELGCHVLDADETSRDVVAPGSEGLKAVVAEFGAGVLQQDGTLDRAKLGTLVFENPERRVALNSILHPFIIARQDQQLREWEAEHQSGIAVVDAALMIESGGYQRFDKLIVVHCRPEVQLQRLLARNNLSSDDAARRIAAQMSQSEKMTFADYLIDTSDGFEAARQRTEEVYRALTEDSQMADTL